MVYKIQHKASKFCNCGTLGTGFLVPKKWVLQYLHYVGWCKNEIMHIEAMTISINNRYYYYDYHHLKLYVFIFEFSVSPNENELHGAGILPV